MNIPPEILIEICHYLAFTDVLKIELCSKACLKLLRCHKWHRIIKVPKRNLNSFFTNYLHKFSSLDFTTASLTNDQLRMVKDCEHLNLSQSEITDEQLPIIQNCLSLDLSNCDNLTNDGVKVLNNVHDLNLSFCEDITIECKEYLKNVNLILGINIDPLKSNYYFECFDMETNECYCGVFLPVSKRSILNALSTITNKIEVNEKSQLITLYIRECIGKFHDNVNVNDVNNWIYYRFDMGRVKLDIPIIRKTVLDDGFMQTYNIYKGLKIIQTRIDKN